MIDYMVIRIKRKYFEKMRPNLSALIEAKFDPGNNGEILWEKYSLLNMSIKVYSSSIILSGSLHYFYNIVKERGSQNHDDFTFTSLCEAFDILEEKLGISLRKERLIQMEIGTNIQLDRNVTEFVNQNILLHNFKTHIVSKEYGKNGILKEYETSQYWVKLYDKGRQFSLDREIGRFELKYKHHSDLRRLGITCFDDLTNIDKFQVVVKDYYNRLFSELIIIDSLDFGSIENPKSKKLLYDGIHPVYWDKMRTELSSRKGLNKPVAPGTIVRRKKRFLELLEIHGLTTIKLQIMNLIRLKICHLTGINVNKRQNRTSFHV